MPRIAFAALLTLALATPSFAQARASGVVRDLDGEPIKGAAVTAINPEASPSEFASTTDDRGRWAMIGLRVGTWTFVADAPGFAQVQATAEVRVTSSTPIVFSLARDPGPLPGALDRTVLLQITRAHSLRDQGQYAEALSVYDAIRQANPKVTSLQLVIADVYRRQAAAETDPGLRRALLERAAEVYGEILEDESVGARARAELEATRAEVAGLPR